LREEKGVYLKGTFLIQGKQRVLREQVAASPSSRKLRGIRRTKAVWLGARGEQISRPFTGRRQVRRMGKKMKGAKVLSKYAAPPLKRSHALRRASHSAEVSGWLSFKSPQSILSALSHSSLLSFVSIASMGSTASILSIGSVGSILSIGSAGSILSIGSAGSILSIGKAGATPGRGSVEPEPEAMLEEEIEEILPDEGPPPREARPMPPPGEPPPEERPEPR
jgi:hypothetical protein